jgi:hypothetical protein
MDKYAAVRLEGMLIASRRYLEAVADQVRETVPKNKRRKALLKIGRALTELVDISGEIYKEHPEANPYLESDRTSAQRHAADKRKRLNKRNRRGPTRQ